jgi:pyrimidine-nucleoside phosphorylase
MDIKSIIQRKRENKELTHDEIRYFIGKYTKEEITDAQAAALMSYIYINGLTETEILEFVKAMAESGDTIDLSEISNNIVDKHSTGGVGDKITIILMPIIAALEIPVAKISSRGLGISGGTIDKLESIPGYDANISIEEFKRIVKQVGVSIMSQNLNIAPAESKMYKLRNQIGCSDSLPLIAISLMSLKLATGGNKFVFDITCGKGTYIKTREDAKRLAKLLNRLGKSLGKEVGCVITAMDEPLGYAIGHNLEIKETIAALKGNMPQDVGEVVVALGSVMLSLATNNKNLDQNAAIIRETIKSGKAYQKFKEMVSAQYGSLEYLEHPEKFKEAKYVMPVFANNNGIIQSIDADMVGSIAVYLGAGRMKNENEINRSAGIVLKKKIGDLVTSGEIVAYIHTDDESKVLGATKNLEEAFVITNKKFTPKSKVLEIV